MSHRLVPMFSEHVQPTPVTCLGCRELCWAPTASQLPSLGAECSVCTGAWVRSGTGCPPWASHATATCWISPPQPSTSVSFTSSSHNFLPFIPQSGNRCEAELKKLEQNRISYWRSSTAALICKTQIKIRESSTFLSLSQTLEQDQCRN